MYRQQQRYASTRIKRATGGVFAACAVTLTGAGSLRAIAAPGRQATTAKAATPAQQIGDASIGGKSVTATVEQNAKRGILDVDLKGQPVVVTSARYDMTAPHIVLTLRGGLVRTGEANGGTVDVAIHNAETHQNTTLRCSKATYVGATEAKPARLHLTGPVHSTTRDPQLAKPLETDAAGADVEFLPDGTNRIVLTDLQATGTPIEPPAKLAKPGEKTAP